MAKDYQLIQQITVGSGGTSAIEFSNIPQNYTELIIKTSLRAVQSTGFLRIRFNDDSSNIYTYRWLYGNGSNSATTSGTDTAINWIDANNSADTASTFNNGRIIIPNYSNTSYQKTITADVVRETNATSATLGIVVGLWPSTSAINKLSIFVTSGNLAQYSTVTLYGAGGTRATGGTITSDANYTYHTFSSTSTFTPLEKIKNAEILLVAGGGGGGGGTFTNANSGGGGGAGGVIAYTGQTFYAGTSYTAVVGAGGTGGSTSVGIGSQGGASTFAALSTVGGGGGGAETGGHGGTTGGSGGGASSYSTMSGSAGTAGQGFAGGSTAGSNGAAAGGGGAGGVGINATNGSFDAGAPGGIGTTVYNNWHFATSTGILSDGTYYIAGGGGGGSYRSFGGPGGLGGGGTGGQSTNDNDTAGTANTGGGGGGSANQGAGRAGSAGGSGLIIIRYPSI